MATGRDPGSGPVDVEVLGVVEDVVSSSLRERVRPSVYFPMPPDPGSDHYSFAVRTGLDPGDIAGSIREAAAVALPGVRISSIQTMDEIVETTISEERFLAQLATTFGLLAIALTSIGLYGILSFAVVRETREIGIRMALGARVPDTIRYVMVRAARTVGVGLVLGLAGAMAASRTIGTLLFGVSPTEPRVVAAAVIVLMTAAAIAAYLPARRASRVDPLVALRND